MLLLLHHSIFLSWNTCRVGLCTRLCHTHLLVSRLALSEGMNQTASAAVFCHRPAPLSLRATHALGSQWRVGFLSTMPLSLSLYLSSLAALRACCSQNSSLALQTRHSAFASRLAGHLGRPMLLPWLSWTMRCYDARSLYAVMLHTVRVFCILGWKPGISTRYGHLFAKLLHVSGMVHLLTLMVNRRSGCLRQRCR